MLSLARDKPLQGEAELQQAIHFGLVMANCAHVVYQGPIPAPIAKGAPVAQLEIAVDGMTPGRVPLYAAESVPVAGPVDRLVNGLIGLLP